MEDPICLGRVNKSQPCFLKELIGSAGGKLHTGRSRNDQVATDMKLWLKGACEKLRKHTLAFIEVVVNRSKSKR